MPTGMGMAKQACRIGAALALVLGIGCGDLVHDGQGLVRAAIIHEHQLVGDLRLGEGLLELGHHGRKTGRFVIGDHHHGQGVGVWGRATNTVAPNSPMLMAKANTAPTISARLKIGQSTASHTLCGEAPSMAAASLNDRGMLRQAGSTQRMTNGNATRAWAMAGSTQDERRLRGGSSRAMMNPKPRVTADVDSGCHGTIHTCPDNLAAIVNPAQNTCIAVSRISACTQGL